MILEEFSCSAEQLCHLGLEVPPIPAPNFGQEPPTSSLAPAVPPMSTPGQVPTVQHCQHSMSGAIQSLPLFASNFPSIAAPPPLPVFSGPHMGQSSINLGGTMSALPGSSAPPTAPVPAAF